MSSRQEAMIVWSVILLAGCMLWGPLRAVLLEAARAVMVRVVLIPICLVTAWIITIVFVLYRAGFWNPSMLYDTVMLAAVGEVALLFRPLRATYNARFFAGWVLASIGLMTVLQVLVDTYPLGFWVEFLVIVPVASVLSVFGSLPIKDDSGRRAQRLLRSIQAALGLGLIAYAIIRAALDLRGFATWQSLESALLPVTVSCALLLPLYVYCLLLLYSEILTTLKVSGPEEDELQRYLKRRIVRRFGIRAGALQRFRRAEGFGRLRRASCRQQVDAALEMT